MALFPAGGAPALQSGTSRGPLRHRWRREHFNGGGVTGHDQRGRDARSVAEIKQAPFRRESRRDERGRPTGIERYLDFFQAVHQALPRRFQIGFLAGPAVEETVALAIGRQRGQFGLLALGKDAPRQARPIVSQAGTGFQVDADLASGL
jgi:hypothetical protein